MPPEALNGVETIVNLARNTYRWEKMDRIQKREIIESRIQSIHTFYIQLSNPLIILSKQLSRFRSRLLHGNGERSDDWRPSSGNDFFHDM